MLGLAENWNEKEQLENHQQNPQKILQEVHKMNEIFVHLKLTPIRYAVRIKESKCNNIFNPLSLDFGTEKVTKKFWLQPLQHRQRILLP